MRRLLGVLLFVGAAALPSCSDDEGPHGADAAHRDGAASDGAGGLPDAAGSASSCATYCTCMTDTCPAAFADSDTCLEACAGLTQSQLICRAQHCGYAKGSTGLDHDAHCQHAVGVNQCP